MVTGVEADQRPLAEGGDVMTLNNSWVAAKLLVAIGVVACCEISAARHRKGRPLPVLMHVALGLTVLNIVVAYAFR